MQGDVAQASYLQLVQDHGQPERDGTRFRKTDVLVRSRSQWVLIGATEVDVPFRRAVVLSAAQTRRLEGRYALAGYDTLAVGALSTGQLGLRGSDGATDTLSVADDSTAFVDGDPGKWRFAMDRAGRVRELRYQRAGARDVVLARVRTP